MADEASMPASVIRAREHFHPSADPHNEAAAPIREDRGRRLVPNYQDTKYPKRSTIPSVVPDDPLNTRYWLAT